MSQNLSKTAMYTETTENLFKFPESRMISVIATVQRTKLSISSEGDSISSMTIEEAHRATCFKTEVLTSKPTFNVQNKELTHRFLVTFILDKTVNGIKDYIWKLFIRDCNNLERSDGTKLFFKFSND